LLGKGRATLGLDQGLFLDVTFRLHPEICAFTSELYYEGRLRPVAGLERQRVSRPSSAPASQSPPSSSPRARQSPRWPGAQSGLFLVEIDHTGNQALSREEVEAVAQLAESFLQPGTTWTDRDGKTRDLSPNDLLVVAPYNAQVSALRTRLSALGVHRVGTVDKFQGQEAPVVIYSCTSSSPEDAPRGMAFLYDPHRFNVATSRARGVVIAVASPRLFEAACRTPEQMRWANGMCRYREVAQVVGSK
jgi:superfamily I DNA and/or RNA helicase